MISTLSIILMIVAMISGIAIPVILAIICKKIFKSSIKMILLGAIIFFIAVVVLEQLGHSIVLGLYPNLVNNTILFAFYGGLMAGIFEETGRLLGYKFFCKGQMQNNGNAIMYGVGHGGFECMYILSIGMISYLVMAFMINNGTTALLTNGVTDQSTINTVQETIDLLIATPSYNFILSIIERLSAITMHISFSILVWFAVKNDKIYLYFISVLLHTLADMITVIINNYLNAILVELVIIIIAVIYAFIAYKIYNKEKLVATDN